MATLVSGEPSDVGATAAQLAYRSLLARKEVGRYPPGEGQICDSFARRWLGVDLGGETRSAALG